MGKRKIDIFCASCYKVASACFAVVACIGLVFTESVAMSAVYTFLALTLAVMAYVADRKSSFAAVVNLTGKTNMDASVEK